MLRVWIFVCYVVALVAWVLSVEIDLFQVSSKFRSYSQTLLLVVAAIILSIGEWRSMKKYRHKGIVAGWISIRSQEILDDLEELWNRLNSVQTQPDILDIIRKQNSSINAIIIRTTYIATQEEFIHDKKLVESCQKEAFDQMRSKHT